LNSNPIRSRNLCLTEPFHKSTIGAQDFLERRYLLVTGALAFLVAVVVGRYLDAPPPSVRATDPEEAMAIFFR
jgi:hypothetical protein